MTGAAHAQVQSIDDLVKELEQQATPGQGFEPNRERLNKATESFVAKYHGKKVSGRDREKEFNKASKLYLESIGLVANDETDEFYGHMMRQWISRDKDGISKAYAAIKEGDKAELAKVFKDAYVTNVSELKAESILRQIELSPFEDREKAYKALAKKVANDNDPDWLQVVKNPTQAYDSLQKLRLIAGAYQKEKPRATGTHN